MLAQLLDNTDEQDRKYTHEEMVEAFIAGYKAMQLIDEEIKPEVIEIAKSFIKKFKR